MGTRDEAEAVLSKAAKKLRKAGAHALQVEPGRAHGKVSATIVAWVSEDDHSVPETVTEKVGNKSVTVPVVTKRSQPFKPE